MKLQTRYDAVILGTHPSALLAACLLAQKEFSVLIVAPEDTFAAFQAKNGQSFDPEPQILLGLGAESNSIGLLSQILKEIHPHSSKKKQSLSVTRSGICVATPDRRVDFSSLKQLPSELKREIDPEKYSRENGLGAVDILEPLILEFWSSYSQRLDQIQSQGVLSHLKSDLAQYFSKYPYFQREFIRWLSVQSDVIKTQVDWSLLRKNLICQNDERSHASSSQKSLSLLWQGLSFGLSSQCSEKSNFWDLTHLLAVAQGGQGLRGGGSEFRKYLLEVAQEHGAHLTQKLCQSIYVKNRQFLGVQLEDSSETIQARMGGVLGQSFHKILSWSHRLNSKKLREFLPLGWRFTIALTVHENGVPQHASSRTIWQEPLSPPLEIEVLDQSHDPRIASQERGVYLRVVLPYEAETLRPEYLRTIGLRMIAQMQEVFPFSEQHLIKQFPNLKEGDGLEDLKSLYSFESLDLIPDSLLVYSPRATTLKKHIGIRSLLVASGEVYPELGTFGWSVSAVEVVHEFKKMRQMQNSK